MGDKQEPTNTGPVVGKCLRAHQSDAAASSGDHYDPVFDIVQIFEFEGRVVGHCLVECEQSRQLL